MEIVTVNQVNFTERQLHILRVILSKLSKTLEYDRKLQRYNETLDTRLSFNKDDYKIMLSTLTLLMRMKGEK
jgi:hypothetical protein